MLRDLFEAICQKQVQANTPVEIKCNDVFVKRFLFNGEVLTVPISPHTRDHRVDNINDLITAVKLYDQGRKAGSLWHNPTGLVYLIDDADRRERIWMPLITSEHWDIVKGLSERRLGQADFVRILRHELHGCVPDTLLPAISKIEVATSSGQRNEINPGRERGTREFAVDLANSGEIPEHFYCQLSVYSNVGLRTNRQIKMGLDYTLPPAQVTFRVAPLPDELEIAEQDAQAELHALLVDAVDIPVFGGQA